MTKKLVQGVVFAIVLTGMQTAMAAGEPERGKQLFQVCGACHGLAGEGNSILSAPINAGQDEWYVVRQIKNFQAGIRGADPKDIFGMQMRPMAATLVDDQAIQDVAAYVTSLSPPKPPLSIEGDI